jgi:two-component system, NtrC family, nitrogen regulation sensor histidine kinase NtrY
MASPSRLGHERRVLLLAVLLALPGTGLGLGLLWNDDVPPGVQWTITIVLLGLVAFLIRTLRRAVVRPLATMTNVVAALREGDFSVRFHLAGRPTDPLEALAHEVNALSSTLRAQRLGAAEAAALLHRVMEEIDVAILSFDASETVRLANRAAERLLGRPHEELLARSATDLGLADFLVGESPRVFEAAFPGGAGRYELRRSEFRQEGVPQRLLVLSNLSYALRQEERQAWQRLIRVLAHELNNSLAPIKSIAVSLEGLLAQAPPPADREDDLRRGIGVIRARSESLERFMGAYAQLARLPPPRLQRVAVRPLVERAARLETRLSVKVAGGPDVEIEADPDQIEQVLINLLRNAAEATSETKGGVSIGWSRDGGGADWLDLWIDDDGPGLPSTTNLFVPFFTTKPQGSGIGLVLSRQIAEAHRGSLTLENRPDARGCRARLRLPSGATAAG